MSHLSRSSHVSRPYPHRGPIDDRDELFPDDSSSMVSSNRSSHRSGAGAGASHISCSSHHSRRTSHRESNLRREMFERETLGPIRENYEESHYSRASHRSGGAHSNSNSNSRALVRRDDYDDGRSHVSRSSRRSSYRRSNRDRDFDREMDSTRSELSRASLSAADQNEALWAKQNQSRSRSAAASCEEDYHDRRSRISRRSSTQRQIVRRSRSLSLEHEHERNLDSISRGRGRALSHCGRSRSRGGALDREDRERYRNNPPHTLETADLRMSSWGMSYNSGLDTRHFKAGDEVDVKSRKNIGHAADGSYSIHDEMDIKMRFGAGVVPGGGSGMSGLRGGGGEDFDHEFGGESERFGSGHRYGIHCTNNMYTCPVHCPLYGMAGAGYRGARRGF